MKFIIVDAFEMSEQYAKYPFKAMVRVDDITRVVQDRSQIDTTILMFEDNRTMCCDHTLVEVLSKIKSAENII